ncbi:MAG: phosphoribosylanthranilate isomerase [Geminicoccaceae bacterium]
MRTRVKICCIASREEAAMAMALGADLLGLVGPMPSGPGVIDLDTARAIAESTPPGVAAVLLTSATDTERLLEEARRVRPAVLQIVDAVPPASYARLRAALPGMRLMQVLHVRGEATLAEARAVAPLVDALLLDSGRPDAPVKELGGTGRTHDWRISRAIVEAVDRPVFLAGGLEAGNVARAVATVRPFGVDLCSGVRRDGRLDKSLLGRFMAAIQAADGSTQQA